MKAKTWRQYYGYKPQTLADLARANDTDLKRQRETYYAWLINAGRVALSEVQSYIESTRREPLISATIERKSNVREEDIIGPLCSVRTIRCASNTTKEQYGYFGWRHLPKSDTPTTYAVIVNGRCVNSFLSKARAKTWAHTQMQEIAT